MKLQETLDLLPGDHVIVTESTRLCGGQLAMSLVQQLQDNRPYHVDRVERFTHENKSGDEIVDRANIYLKGYAGLRFNPASFKKVKEK